MCAFRCAELMCVIVTEQARHKSPWSKDGSCAKDWKTVYTHSDLLGKFSLLICQIMQGICTVSSNPCSYAPRACVRNLRAYIPHTRACHSSCPPLWCTFLQLLPTTSTARASASTCVCVCLCALACACAHAQPKHTASGACGSGAKPRAPTAWRRNQ